MTKPDWIAVDWGTTMLRAWAMGDDDTVLDTARSSDGMGTLSPEGFEPALARLIAPWLADKVIDVMACGMVGARQGWIEAPYAPVPAAPQAIAPITAPVGMTPIRMRILPGLRQDTPPDVMRGEETQIAGLLAAEAQFDGVACLPGTHTKWVRISAGEIVSFQTSMTGEMFDLLSRQSVLRHAMGGANGSGNGAESDWDAAAFAEAVDRTLTRPETLAAGLFGIRAASLLSGTAPGTARARLSGLLIGAELAATRAYWLGTDIAIIGAPALSAAYHAALQAQGAATRLMDGSDLTLRGLCAAHRLQRRGGS